jgi:RNA polymerase sigma factor (sigma-70 family)
MEERACVVRALEGDEVAVRQIVEHLTPVIQAKAARALLRSGGAGKSRHEIADLIQDIFVVLFEEDRRVLRRWDPETSSLRTFVAVVAERRVISILRTRGAQRDLPLESGETPLVGEDESGEVEAGAAGREQLARVWEQLRRELSPLGLTMFRAIFVEEKTVAEITDETGLTPEAIYAWRSRIRKRARAVWSESEDKANVAE